jgi:NhaA family Na+:H+ antiporter
VTGIVSEPVTVGVALGLLIGKPAGVLIGTALAVRIGIGRLPSGTTWRHIAGLAMVAGIGFTVALFVAGLSFDDPERTDAAKLGILVGSLFAGVFGYALLRFTAAVRRPDDAAYGEPATA